MKKTTIKNKLYFLIGIMIFGLICMGFLSYFMMSSLKNSNKKLVENYCTSTILANDINNLASNYRECQYNHITATTTYSKSLYEEKLFEISHDIIKLFDNYEKLIIHSKDKELFQQTKAKWQHYFKYYSGIISLGEDSDEAEALGIYSNEAWEAYQGFKDSIDQLILYDKENIQIATLENDERFSQLISYTILIISVIILFAFLAINHIAKSIRKPINNLICAARQMSNGYLDVKIDCSSNDEIAELYFSTETLIKKLNHIINDVKTILGELSSSNFEVSSSCKEEYVGDFYPIIESLDLLKESLEMASSKEYQAILFQELSQNVDVVFMIYDLEIHNMEYVFANAKRILGIPPEKLKSDPLEFFSHCESSIYEAATEIFVLEKLASRYNKDTDYTNPQTGKKKRLSITITPVINEYKTTKYIMSIEDLTEYHKTHEILKDALLNAQNATIAKSMFFSSISHEIRTPLNAIIGMTTIASSYLDDRERVNDCLKKIASSSNHLFMLINDVLDMAKIESGKLTLNNETFNLEDILNDVTAIFSTQIKEKNLKFDVFSKNCQYCILKGDVLRLKQVLINILSNAIKYTPGGGYILISVMQYSKKVNNTIKVQFTISDTGYGMTPEYLDKLFDPFVQEINASSRKNIGTGLGMPIVKNLVSLMNGSIRVKSALGKGSTFIVTLPFIIASSEKNIYKNKKLTDLKILVIDSDINSIQQTKFILDKMGILAHYTDKGKEGLQKIDHSNITKDFFDIILVDLDIADMSGISIIHLINTLHGADTLTIATGYDIEGPRKEALAAGANAFVVKPIQYHNIYNTLITIQNSSGQIQESNIHKPQNLNEYRILIVEDNELNMEIAVELLKQTGAKLECAYNGREAELLFLNKPPGYYNLIIMDIQMPVLNGYQATTKIRNSAHEDAKIIPIIAMTSNAYLEDINEALICGMNAHITKPIDINTLYDILYKQLNINR